MEQHTVCTHKHTQNVKSKLKEHATFFSEENSYHFPCIIFFHTDIQIIILIHLAGFGDPWHLKNLLQKLELQFNLAH